MNFGPISTIAGQSGGTFDTSSKSVTYPVTPNISILTPGEASGIHLYQMNKTTLSNFSEQILWQDTLWELINVSSYNPLSCVLSCHILPYVTSPTQKTSYSVHIAGNSFAWTPASSGSYLAEFQANQQFTTITFDPLEVPEYFGSFLDYAPYTKAQLYLPFIGVIDLSVNAFMGGQIQIKYIFNNVDGSCSALVRTRDRNDKYLILNTGTGNCAFNIPIVGGTNETALNIAKAAGGVATGLAAGLISGGAGIATLGGALSELEWENSPTSLISSVSAIAQGASGISQAGEAALSPITAPKTTATVGSVTGNMACMSMLYPILYIMRPEQSRPDNSFSQYGRPSNVFKKLSDLEGFNSFSSIKVKVPSALESEKNEIGQLLMTGVIF